jgi:hypothetical protein
VEQEWGKEGEMGRKDSFPGPFLPALMVISQLILLS